MKRPFLLYALLLISLPGFSQKLNTKEFSVEAKYIRLPEKGFDPTYSTYEVVVDSAPEGYYAFGETPASIKRAVALDGYKSVAGGGSIILHVNVGTPTADKPVMKTAEKTDSEGKKSKDYWYTQALIIHSEYTIKDYKGATIATEVVTNSEDLETSKYASAELLNTAFQKTHQDKLAAKLKSLLTDNIKAIRGQINYAYGLSPIAVKTNFETLQEKDHPDLAKYNNIKLTVEKAFEAMTAQDASKMITLLQPAVDFWMAEEKKYDPLNKDQRKMNYAMRLNLASAYLWTGELDKALVYCNKIAQGDVSAGDGKKLSGEIAGIKDKLNKLKRTSRNFALMPSAEETERSAGFEKVKNAAYATGDIRVFEEFNSSLAVKANSKIEPATLFYKSGRTETGYLVFESSRVSPDFLHPEATRFGMADGHNIIASSLDYTSLDSMQINGYSYRVQDVTPKAGILKIEFKYAVLEVGKNFKRSAIVIVHPTREFENKLLANSGEPPEPGVVIYHKERREYLIPDSISGFTKGMSNIVADCQSAVDYLNTHKGPSGIMVEERLKTFADTDNMTEALKIYDSCK